MRGGEGSREGQEKLSGSPDEARVTKKKIQTERNEEGKGETTNSDASRSFVIIIC